MGISVHCRMLKGGKGGSPAERLPSAMVTSLTTWQLFYDAWGSSTPMVYNNPIQTLYLFLQPHRIEIRVGEVRPDSPIFIDTSGMALTRFAPTLDQRALFSGSIGF